MARPYHLPATPAPRGMYHIGAYDRAHAVAPVALAYAVRAVYARRRFASHPAHDAREAARRADLAKACEAYGATYEATGEAYAGVEGYIDGIEGDTVVYGDLAVSVVACYASGCVEAYDDERGTSRLYEGDPRDAMRDLARWLRDAHNIVAPSYATV